MTRIARLDDDVLVAGQIDPAAMDKLRSMGVTMLVGNRPDREEPGQPDWAEIVEAARSAGIETWHIPITGGASDAAVQAMAEALEATAGQTLAFCRSGTRSAWLWALARLSRGADRDEIVRKAADAGYDLSPLLGD